MAKKHDDQGAALVQVLQNIIAMETGNGFQNKAVGGGLDGFFATLQREAARHPAVRQLTELGLLSVGYAELTLPQRQRWAAETKRLLEQTALPPKPASAANRPPEPSKANPAAEPTHPSLGTPITVLRSANRPQAAAIQRMLIKRHLLPELRDATIRDLLYLFPIRHVDYTQQRPISQLRIGEEQTITATLWEAYEIQVGRGGRRRATQAIVGDDTGNLRVIWWGNPWVAQQLRKAIDEAGKTVNSTPRVTLSGKVKLFQGKRQMESPEWEVTDPSAPHASVHTSGFVPIYPSAATTKPAAAKPRRIPPRKMREIVRDALDRVKVGGRLQVPDPLPDSIRREVKLLTLPEAIGQAHYPSSDEAKEQARRRLAFDEFLPIQLKLGMERNYREKQPGITLPSFPGIVQSFIASLPFELTDGQQSALSEAMADVSSGGKPMNRLLQGDVGSGKTVVALAMMLTAVAGDYQGVMMAPTEVLAEQHFLNVRRLLTGTTPLMDNPDYFAADLGGRQVTVGLLTGSTRTASRREIQRMAADGSLDILVGTHALIQRDVELPNLALAVVDEQHRFGVLQRDAMRGKSSVGEPHLLLMSATPIPRSLALAIYGDLDISTIRELPKGRQEIITRSGSLAQSGDAEAYLVTQVRAGRQCFIVYPHIDESDDQSGDDDTEYEDDYAGDDGDENSDFVPEPASLPVPTAVAEYERLRSTTLSEVRVGLLHGRMPLKQKQEVMDQFRAGDIDVLVSTPVIEVGIDVPNATVMMIQGATRFGLAQLHQLRGRVGRGAHQSYCFLVAESESETLQRLTEGRRQRIQAKEDPQEVQQWFKGAESRAQRSRDRLNELVRTNDGFEIAEADLRMRSQGDFFGKDQSGAARIRMARLDDRDLLAASRDAAATILDTDPQLDTLPELLSAVERLTTAVTSEMA